MQNFLLCSVSFSLVSERRGIFVPTKMVIKYLCGSLSKMKAPLLLLEHTQSCCALLIKRERAKSDADKKTVYYRNVMKVEIRWREISSPRTHSLLSQR